MGKATDVGQVDALLQLTPAGAEALLGNKGYDNDAFVQAILDKRHVSGYSAASQQPNCAA